MSIIQKIQDRGAWIISILIGIALIAFIMMDYSKGGSGLFSNTTVVGKVNGEKIDVNDFNKKVDAASQMQQAQGQPREAVQEYVWNSMVKTALLNQAYKQLGLVSTSKDLSNAIGINPTQSLRQAFSDPQTGQYDGQRASQIMNEIKRRGNAQQKQQVADLIDETNDEILLYKYQSLLMGGVYVPSWLAEKTNTDNNAIVKMSYVQTPYSTVSDSAVKVTDEDINTYIAAHKKIFEQKDETRNLSVVVFNAGASPADSANALASINALRQDFITTKDDSAFIASKSGSYLNEYISAAQMMVKQMPYAQVLTTPVDSLYGPYVFNGNYLLAKMISKISMPDTVKFRSIAVATMGQDPQTGQVEQMRSDSDAEHRLDSAVAAIKAGASFDSIALKYSDDQRSAQKGGVYDNVVSGQQDVFPDVNNFVFSGKTGEAKIIKTPFGLFYVEILAQKGSTEGYKIASVSRSIDPAQSTIDSVDNLAASFAAASQSQQAFQQSAREKNIPVIPINGLKENDYQIGNFGVDRELVKWAYSHKVGEVSQQPVHIGSNVVVATLTAIEKPGVMDAATARPYVQAVIANQKKAKIIIASKFKGSSLTDYAASTGVTVQTVDSIAFQNALIPNVGSEPKVVGAAFNASLLNKTSQPIAGNSGVFAIEPLNVSAKSSLDGGPEQIKLMLKQSQIQQIQRTFMDALQNAAKIEDKRSKFF